MSNRYHVHEPVYVCVLSLCTHIWMDVFDGYRYADPYGYTMSCTCVHDSRKRRCMYARSM